MLSLCHKINVISNSLLKVIRCVCMYMYVEGPCVVCGYRPFCCWLCDQLLTLAVATCKYTYIMYRIQDRFHRVNQNTLFCSGFHELINIGSWILVSVYALLQCAIYDVETYILLVISNVTEVPVCYASL